MKKQAQEMNKDVLAYHEALAPEDREIAETLYGEISKTCLMLKIRCGTGTRCGS